jgi:CheY-like chemotaxis protein
MKPPETRPVILLVEDDENDRLFFKRAVGKGGYDWILATATTGREAVEFLSGSGKFADRAAHPAPTHVLLDLKLPELSGLEVLEWIRSRPPLADLPVIVLSSSRESSDLERAKRIGIDAYEVKPVEFVMLVETVRSIARHWSLSGAPAPDALRVEGRGAQ